MNLHLVEWPMQQEGEMFLADELGKGLKYESKFTFDPLANCGTETETESAHCSCLDEGQWYCSDQEERRM